MTAFGKFLRTTAVKLSLLYFVVFSALTGFLLAYTYFSTTALLSRTLEASITTEIAALSEEYMSGGLRRVVETVLARSRQPSASLYLVKDFAGRVVVGNVADMPLGAMERTETGFYPVTYSRLDGNMSEPHDAIVRIMTLPGGVHLLVGRDIGEREAFGDMITDAMRLSVVVFLLMGLVSWFFVSRAVLRRVDGMAATSREIMSGDLTRRIEVTGAGDEFDNLAASLNAMLDRIEALMTGLKEVSDNVAHDLRTPLTRLRTRLETTLGDLSDEAASREAIGRSVEEADELIRTFDDLLRIARVEAGASGDETHEIDAAAILADVAELYEPVVEEAGGRIELVVSGPLPIRANRALISQALANLVDNALKYGFPAEGDTHPDGRAPVLRIAGETTGGLVRLSVTDNGPGIAAEDRLRATQRFVRLDRSRTRPGSGLGLSLVAAVARYFSGRFRLEDAGPGLAATLELPLADNGPAQRQEQGETTHARDGRPPGFAGSGVSPRPHTAD
ncbi:sensor histidine kinase [Methylobrevis pamukkalensis]|uniref:histidine kinase n=1 Tax=Methylobrevis pamukkalensis TaxID=1439726 RepID=A0A1E3H344_9HYPH|nr:ATP-binding protein [Methylobrevis pamukkalensis]ODN70565.1 Sensor protein RstB [Methylobrevis pamukkalensis]